MCFSKIAFRKSISIFFRCCCCSCLVERIILRWVTATEVRAVETLFIYQTKFLILNETASFIISVFLFCGFDCVGESQLQKWAASYFFLSSFLQLFKKSFYLHSFIRQQCQVNFIKFSLKSKSFTDTVFLKVII